MPPILTVFLSLQRRVHHEALRGPPHTWPELLWPGKDVLPMVQKVLLGQAKVAMLCAPWAHVQKSSFVFFSPKVCEGETCFLQKSWIFQVKTAPRLFPPITRLCGGGWVFFFCFGVHRRDLLLRRKIGISCSPELAEMAIIARSVPAFPAVGAPRGSVPLGGGHSW